MVYVALSCLQGRPMESAFRALSALDVDGVQLTPGNVATPCFPVVVAESGSRIRTHHGFRWHQRQPALVWKDGRCVSRSDSVHPPAAGMAWWDDVLARPDDIPLLETMYPGYELGDGPAVERAMDAALRLAVDVSHVHIQQTAGVMSQATWRRLQDYEHVGEVHVSANDGTSDQHAPLTLNSFGLAWALSRGRAGTPVVLECYMHRLSDHERHRQVALATGAR
jgi:hypothetical protein